MRPKLFRPEFAPRSEAGFRGQKCAISGVQSEGLRRPSLHAFRCLHAADQLAPILEFAVPKVDRKAAERNEILCGKLIGSFLSQAAMSILHGTAPSDDRR
jgi:hypothetical protein